MRPAAIFRETHAIADKQEAILRVRLVAAFKALQDSVSINDVAVMMHSGMHRHIGPVLIPATRIQKQLEGPARVVEETVMRGGRLGAEKLNTMRRNG